MRQNKKRRGKTDIEIFVEILGEVFDTDFFRNIFELRPLPRKKPRGKKNRMVGWWVWELANARGGGRRKKIPAPRVYGRVTHCE
jgi:hypothetical protein